MEEKNENNPASLDTIKRKRGGQPSNHNAFQHGFYSDQFKPAEKLKLAQVPNADLSSEIELIRVQIHRYLEAENVELNRMDFETRLQALRAVSLAAESLTRLIRTQIVLNNGGLEQIQEENPQSDTTAQVG